MSDIGRGIGDAMVFLAVLVAFFVPCAIGASISFVLMLFGWMTAATVAIVIGLIAGIVCAALVARAA